MAEERGTGSTGGDVLTKSAEVVGNAIGTAVTGAQQATSAAAKLGSQAASAAASTAASAVSAVEGAAERTAERTAPARQAVSRTASRVIKKVKRQVKAVARKAKKVTAQGEEGETGPGVEADCTEEDKKDKEADQEAGRPKEDCPEAPVGALRPAAMNAEGRVTFSVRLIHSPVWAIARRGRCR